MASPARLTKLAMPMPQEKKVHAHSPLDTAMYVEITLKP